MERIPRAPFGNQATPVPDRNTWTNDASANWWLAHLLDRVDATEEERAAAERMLSRVGEQVGSHALRAAADTANRNEPTFVAGADARGSDDAVEFDPAWDTCIDAVCSSGVCATGVTDERAGWIVRAAAMEQWARLDIGVMCPVTMTSAALPLLVRARDEGSAFAGELVARIIAAASGERERPFPLVGMAMTEPQGGSDLAGSTVQAVPTGDGAWELSGHKWFCSHPTSDALLVLARDPEAGEMAEGTRALSCFLIPGRDPRDGSRNGIVVQRLKDKLGTRSLASAEVVFDRARGERIGGPGRGVPTIMQMVVGTRMDCAIGSAGVMARALDEVTHFARERRAFGAHLIDQPLMRMVLADLLLEREAALALAFEVARGVQMGGAGTSGLITAAAKYWITRRAVQVCIESVEALGGNGYTEEFVLARLYRDAQVNSTWEGAGNVIALDVLRSLTRDPGVHAAVIDDVECLVAGADDSLRERVLSFARAIEVPTSQADARRYAGRIALALQAALLSRRATVTGAAEDRVVASACIATRLEPSAERVFGDGDRRLAAAADVLMRRYDHGAELPAPDSFAKI
jgi:putative acyl-CoA dehydrogenase